MKKISILSVLFAILIGLSFTSCKTQLVINDLEFETGKAAIKPGALTSLDKVATVMGTKKFKIQVDGYTDNVGDAATNKKLSEQRAQAVKDYLKTKGVTEERIVANGWGSDFSIADNTTDEGRQKNRRTEVKVPFLTSFKFKKQGLVTRKAYLDIN